MIINDFDIIRIVIFPDKTNPPLIVYIDAVLASAIALEFFEVI